MMTVTDETVRVGKLPMAGWAVPHSSGRFEPLKVIEPGAAWMDFLIVREPITGPLIEWSGEIVDVVGWQAEQPGAWWRLHRAANMLGSDELTRACGDARPARLCDSPLDWLQANCDPLCVLDWWQDWSGMAFMATAVVAQSPDLAMQLRQHVPAIDIFTASATDIWRKR
jgi:hypothetical protein